MGGLMCRYVMCDGAGCPKGGMRVLNVWIAYHVFCVRSDIAAAHMLLYSTSTS